MSKHLTLVKKSIFLLIVTTICLNAEDGFNLYNQRDISSSSNDGNGVYISKNVKPILVDRNTIPTATKIDNNEITKTKKPPIVAPQLSPAPTISEGAETQAPPVSDLIVDEVEIDKLKKAVEERDRIQRELSTMESKNISFINRDVSYNFKNYRNVPIDIYLKKGYMSEIEFVDETGKPIDVAGVSVGNRIFNIKQSASNILNIEPIIKYKNTNMNIRLKDYSGNITFRVVEDEEGYENQVDNVVKIIVSTGQKENVNSSDSTWALKRNIVTELYKYGTLTNAKNIPYSVYDDSRDITSVKYFNNKDLNVYRVSKFGKKYLVVSLSINYKLLGYEKEEFSQYENSFKIYFLPYTIQTFRILTNLEDNSYNLPLGRLQDNNGVTENYRIVLEE